MYKISIPKPCFQQWDDMTPKGVGRHCDSCTKTVVDFTAMSDEAVQQYFIKHQGEHVCGRFMNNQVERIRIELPANIFSIRLPYWKKFLVVFLVIYGSTFLGIDTAVAATPIQGGALTDTIPKTDTVPPIKPINSIPPQYTGEGYDTCVAELPAEKLPSILDSVILAPTADSAAAAKDSTLSLLNQLKIPDSIFTMGSLIMRMDVPIQTIYCLAPTMGFSVIVKDTDAVENIPIDPDLILYPIKGCFGSPGQTNNLSSGNTVPKPKPKPDSIPSTPNEFLLPVNQPVKRSPNKKKKA